MSAYVNLTEGTVHDLGDGHKMVRFENFLPDADFNTLATHDFNTESVTSAPTVTIIKCLCFVTTTIQV